MLKEKMVYVNWMDEIGHNHDLETSVTYDNESGVVTCNYEGASDIKCFINCRDGSRVAWCTLEEMIIGQGYSNLELNNKWVSLYAINHPFPMEKTVLIYGGRFTVPDLVEEFEGEKYFKPYFQNIKLKHHDGTITSMRAPRDFYDNFYFCETCGCYIEDSTDYYGSDLCIWCHDEYIKYHPIQDYCESHHQKIFYYGAGEDNFAGLGFELEVENSNNGNNAHNKIASEIIENCGFDTHELRYAWDGSVEEGFEIISMPHTVRDFWDKAQKWESMLKFLNEKGYYSHNGGHCGLHIHVSRLMFGKTEEEQDRAIAKVYTFFDENWSELVKVSRREYFGYCDKNKLYSLRDSDPVKVKYNLWRKNAKGDGGHGNALNNRNKATFEYRLGRGTLNAWSFFSWVDLIITITKNAKRINVDKICSNDLVSWLSGIKESTAKYIYKRGAFKSTMLTLYPSIAWETDLVERH